MISTSLVAVMSCTRNGEHVKAVRITSAHQIQLNRMVSRSPFLIREYSFAPKFCPQKVARAEPRAIQGIMKMEVIFRAAV